MYYTVQQPVASDASDARAKVLYVLYARAQHTVQCQYYYLVVRLSTTVFVPVRSVQLYSAVHAMLQHVLLLYLLRSSYLSRLWNSDTGTVPSTYRYYVHSTCTPKVLASTINSTCTGSTVLCRSRVCGTRSSTTVVPVLVRYRTTVITVHVATVVLYV